MIKKIQKIGVDSCKKQANGAICSLAAVEGAKIGHFLLKNVFDAKKSIF
jgi:hypothetical protein